MSQPNIEVIKESSKNLVFNIIKENDEEQEEEESKEPKVKARLRKPFGRKKFSNRLLNNLKPDHESSEGQESRESRRAR